MQQVTARRRICAQGGGRSEGQSWPVGKRHSRGEAQPRTAGWRCVGKADRQGDAIEGQGRPAGRRRGDAVEAQARDDARWPEYELGHAIASQIVR